jgi:hypothetical protein
MVESPRGIVQPAAPIPGLEAARASGTVPSTHARADRTVPGSPEATPADTAQQCMQSDSFMIVGYHSMSARGGIGSLMLSAQKNGLVYVGSVDTGFKSAMGFSAAGCLSV